MTHTKSSFMQIDVQDGIATIALDRPPVNVIHIPLLEEMANAFDRLAEDSEVRVLVLAAKGKMFSAGVDVADHTADKVGRMIPLFKTQLSLRNLALSECGGQGPTIAYCVLRHVRKYSIRSTHQAANPIRSSRTTKNA